jgi:hypothetical protein
MMQVSSMDQAYAKAAFGAGSVVKGPEYHDGKLVRQQGLVDDFDRPTVSG